MHAIVIGFGIAEAGVNQRLRPLAPSTGGASSMRASQHSFVKRSRGACWGLAIMCSMQWHSGWSRGGIDAEQIELLESNQAVTAIPFWIGSK
jgi:hypothetical protein